MRLLLLFLLSFSFQPGQAQDDPPLDELEVEGEIMDEEFPEEEPEEEEETRRPPAPSSRFRTPSKRFGGGNKRPSFRRKKGGGGEDRLGKTEGQIKFELAEPPKYYKRKNKPYLMPPKGN